MERKLKCEMPLSLLLRRKRFNGTQVDKKQFSEVELKSFYATVLIFRKTTKSPNCIDGLVPTTDTMKKCTK